MSRTNQEAANRSKECHLAQTEIESLSLRPRTRSVSVFSLDPHHGKLLAYHSKCCGLANAACYDRRNSTFEVEPTTSDLR